MKEVWVLVTDGFADWEASYVSAELNNPKTGFQVKTIAIDKSPKVSMGGFRVLPDYDLHDDPAQVDLAMLIIPGGTGWRDDKNQQAAQLVQHCVDREIPVAGICDATTFLANHGFLENNKHTGNSIGLLKEGAPHYSGDRHYIEAQSVSDGNIITANGTGAVEFAKHILEKLGVYEGEQLEEWYTLFKKGYLAE
ncbi:type 1 glutamine amidotransferase family protein [Paenibacillus sp. UNC451MF]|uniref:type 1 glutamine amidotransferase family protein n=1 Tax=Paenibacillus sp. UNC451MF TaxID=1449063 RepID=UPI00048AB0A8|nr:type 1 glutamine amidotransferase family protein [Paenibacillus sp. UNC451MF]